MCNPYNTEKSDLQALFKNYLSAKKPLIENRLTKTIKALSQDLKSKSLLTSQQKDLDSYLFDPLFYFSASGGKRMRPLLCLLGCEAVGGDFNRALVPACSFELFQSAALIHDDIADESELRRGEPCLYKREGTGIAINVGDLALGAMSSNILADSALNADLKLKILNELHLMLQKTIEGQALDLGWARDARWDIQEQDYLFMAAHKTAYYSAATPLAVGALCAEGTADQIEALKNFGMNCGLAFQLQDDLLNLIGDPLAQGKDFRSDITEGKRTLIALYALAHLEPADKQQLLGYLTAQSEDEQLLEHAVCLIEKSGALTYVQDMAKKLTAQAKSHLKSASFDHNILKILLAVADFFEERSS